MKKFKGLSYLLGAAAILASGLAVRHLCAQEFYLHSVEVTPEGRLIVRHPSDPAYYYILHRGSEVADIVLAVDMALGIPIQGELGETADPEAQAAFYRVQQVSVTDPLDTDGDGIDDAWELRFRRPGAALNGFDAQDDHTASGQADALDYQRPTAYFALKSSTALKGGGHQVAVRFTRPFTGNLLFSAGGTALPNMDYAFTAGGVAPGNSGFVRTLAVNSASEALIPLNTLESDSVQGGSQLVLSLVQPPDSAYRVLGTAVHVADIRDSEIGTFLLSLVFTNGTSVPSQAFSVSLRSDTGVLRARLRAPESSFMTAPEPVLVEILTTGDGIRFLAPVLGHLPGVAPGATAPFSLHLSPPELQDQVFVMSASLEVQGLSASGKSLVAGGLAFLTKVSP